MKNLFEYIQTEEANWKTQTVPIADGYNWNMYNHIRRTVLYINSKYTEGDNDGSRPFRNIITRIINLQHLATGFDVKDIEPFVDDSENYYKSLLTRKFHPRWARKHNLDTFIDETVESYVDFGLALTKHAGNIAPESVKLQTLAFCDQTDILSGPICLKHSYSPDQLKEMEGKGWKNVDKVIRLAKQDKTDATGKIIGTPGKNIEVYEIDGMFPKQWENDEEMDFTEDIEFTRQFHLITFYKDEKESTGKQGIALYHGKGDPDKYKALKRDTFATFGRACGLGGVEELFEAQVWVNYDEIRIQGMLDAASKIIHVTTDTGFATRNNLRNMDNNEVATVAEGKEVHQLNTQPVNLVAFQNASNKWEEHAQGVGSAYNAILGQAPTSGTPFKLQEAVINQGQDPHEYRKGKVSTYLGEIYRDWILKDLSKEMAIEQTFSETLSMEEIKTIGESLVTNETNKMIITAILNGEIVTPELVDMHKQMVRDNFMKKGNRHFFKIFKGELKNLPIDVDINIAGKQKNLSQMTDKLVNIFRQILANPQGFQQAMQITGVPETFNDILESSGLKQRNYGFQALPPPQAQQELPSKITPEMALA
jgi:hypothetical protein